MVKVNTFHASRFCHVPSPPLFEHVCFGVWFTERMDKKVFMHIVHTIIVRSVIPIFELKYSALYNSWWKKILLVSLFCIVSLFVEAVAQTSKWDRYVGGCVWEPELSASFIPITPFIGTKRAPSHVRSRTGNKCQVYVK